MPKRGEWRGGGIIIYEVVPIINYYIASILLQTQPLLQGVIILDQSYTGYYNEKCSEITGNKT